MSAQQQPQPSGNGGATAPAGAPTPPPIRNEYDERNMKFCGPSWSEANDSCTLKTWCPMGNECDANSGQICWGGVANCNAFKLLELEDAPGVNNNGGGGGADTVEVEPPPQQCSSEVFECKSGQFVARAPELNCAFYPCPVLPLMETTNAPTTNKAPTYVPTYAPTMAKVVVPDPVTMAPTMEPTVWVDNDENDTTNNSNNNEGNSGDGDGDVTSTNLWCGESRFDATRNCGRKGYECLDGNCLQDLSCYKIGNECEIGGTATTTGDASDTYFCGVTHTDAVSSCHKRCRSGSPAECPTGESCFRNVYQCSAEIPRPDPTSPPTLSPPTLSPVTQAPSSHPTDNNLVVTTSPTVGADNGPAVQPPNLPGLYCARSMDELEASCSTAQECGGSEPCLIGQMCYPYECKGSSDSSSATLTTTAEPTLPSATTTAENMPLPPESGGVFGWFCGSSFEELDTTCSTTAQKCVYERQDCPSGQGCYQYYCNNVASENQVVENDATEATPGSNGSAEQPIQNSESSYCASSIAQLDERCGLALQCATDNDCNVQGEICMKYDCRQNLMQCPLNFVGWHSSKDCKQYYYCEQGVSSSSDVCGDGMKFDKTRDKCTTDYVDELCYGLASYEHNSGSITQPGAAKILCPPGFTGWHSSDGCNEYQKCTAGTPGPTRVCGFGLKFDTARGQCIDEALVNIDLCEGPLPQGSLCPSWSFIGWGVKDDCAEYFYCKNGNTDFIDRCADGLLFDMQAGICKPADAVNCGGPILPSNNIVDDTSGNINTPTSTPIKDLDNSFEWSNTASPTVSQSDSKIPPWMFFKRDVNGAMRTTNLQVGLFAVASISWMLL